MEGIEIYSKIIKGRVEPHIYAFSTNEVPSHTKVGDTYRAVNVRLDEWRTKYKDLSQICEESALVNREIYFRDHAVHSYLEANGHKNLRKDEFPPNVNYSCEFYEDVKEEDVKKAVKEIRERYGKPFSPYTYYNVEDRLPEEDDDYPRTEPWEPRDNQKQVIKNFLESQKNHKNLLMFAVMRFGKTFTSLCCAKEMDARLIVVVSGKTSVRQEWKENVQRPLIFKGFHFVDSESLKKDHKIISRILAEDENNRIVVFLTLQDLLGIGIKTHHEELFEFNKYGKIDLLIVDETHFAARSSQTGAVLNEVKITKAEKEGDDDSIEELENAIKVFKPEVKLHLSGTPYRILLNGEFQEDDIIAKIQYRDIFNSQQEWYSNKDNLDKNEWDNPYYGFPQMIRFAFNLNKSAFNKLEQLKKDGKEYGLNELFMPLSIKEDNTNGKHKVFKHKIEVVDLLKAIEGSKEDSNIFAFLNYDKIKKGDMCHHIVMVLPWRASCDAMEYLLKDEDFNLLKQYKILNISGYECPESFNKGEYSKNIKEYIKECEGKGEKTITLTVGKMLTGSTVAEWDTMLFLKETSSPQEYDQAIYRLQSKFVKKLKWNLNPYKKDSEEEYIERDMKPQTLLVDFDPTRMFRIQYEKSLVANAALESKKGNEALKKGLQEDLKISPIIYLNHNEITQITESDIIKAIRNYDRNKSVLDETFDIYIDNNLFANEELKKLINQQAEITDLKNIFELKPNEGEGTDVEIDDNDNNDKNSQALKDKEKKKKEKNEQLSLKKKLQTYYFKILLFTYLSDYEEKSLEDVIKSIETYDDCSRIAENLMLDLRTLRLISKEMHFGCLASLDRKINNINSSGKEEKVDVETALRKFSRLSDNIIVTPPEIAKDMVDNLPDKLNENSRFLNIAGKTGEFEKALIDRYKDGVKKNIYTIPLNGVTYECTLKVYKMLGIPINNIYKLYSFDLIDPQKKEKIINELKDMKFDAIIGNPPYNNNKATEKAGINKAFSSAIYPQFFDVSRLIGAKYISLITPSRWLTKTGQGIKEEWVDEVLSCNHFIYMNDYYNALDVFNHVEVKGGVSYFLYDKDYTGKCKYTLCQNGIFYPNIDYLNSSGAGIVIRDPVARTIIDKIRFVEGDYHIEHNFSSLVSPQHYFDKNGVLTTTWKGYKMKKSKKYYIKYYLSQQVEKRGYAWIKESDVPKHKELLPTNKVYISKAYNGGDSFPHQIIGKPILGEPNSLCSQTYLVVGYNIQEHNYTKEDCLNIISYMKTSFFRFMVFIKKKTQDNPSSVFQFVPLQDFTNNGDIDWSKSIDEIDNQLYKKYNIKEEIRFIKSMIKPME